MNVNTARVSLDEILRLRREQSSVSTDRINKIVVARLMWLSVTRTEGKYKMKRKVVFAAFILILAGGCARSPEAKRSAYVTKGKVPAEARLRTRCPGIQKCRRGQAAGSQVYYSSGSPTREYEDYRWAVAAFRRNADLIPSMQVRNFDGAATLC